MILVAEMEAGTGAHPGSLFPADGDIQVLVPGAVLRERGQESWRGKRADLAAESRKRRPALMLQNRVVHNCVFMSRWEVCPDHLPCYQAHPGLLFKRRLAKESKKNPFFLLLQMKSGIPDKMFPLQGGEKGKSTCNIVL